MNYGHLSLLCAVLLASSVANAQLKNFKNETPHPRVVDQQRQVEPNVPKGVDIKWMVPPEPSKMNWEPERLAQVDADGNPLPDKVFEHTIEVTHIKFDWQSGHSVEGMNIRWNQFGPADLDHAGDGKGDGEYIAPDDPSSGGGVGGPKVGRSDPALWIAGIGKPQIKVRLRLRRIDSPSPLAHSDPTQPMRAQIRAENIFAAGTVQPAGLMNWKERQVYFKDGISRDYNILTGEWEDSEYVIFELEDDVPAKFGDYIAKYKCFIKEMEYDDPDSGWIPADHQDEVQFDLTTRIDMYSVLAAPSQPWNYDEASHPWVSALAFACYPCDAAGKATIEGAVNAVATHLFSGHGVKYDHWEGRSFYVHRVKPRDPPEGIVLVGGEYYRIDLNDYMLVNEEKSYAGGNAGTPSSPINPVGCFDQAGAVTTLSNLMQGGTAEFQRHQRFGYINAVDHVGGTKANNPFYWYPRHNPDELLGTSPDYESDLHYYSPKVNGKIARSAFGYHAYVLVDGNVVDATIGPVKPSDGKDVSEYLAEVRDTSTEDEEKLPNPFNLDVEEIARPVLDSGDTYSTKLDKRQ